MFDPRNIMSQFDPSEPGFDRRQFDTRGVFADRKPMDRLPETVSHLALVWI